MPTCVPADPPQYRTLKRCVDGFWVTKKQQLFKCDDETTTWVDLAGWTPTGDPC